MRELVAEAEGPAANVKGGIDEEDAIAEREAGRVRGPSRTAEAAQ